MIYSVVLVSGVWPSESVYTHTYIHSFLRLPSHIGHDKGLSALCYTVDSVSFFLNIESNHQPKSRTSDMQMTPPLWQKVKN